MRDYVILMTVKLCCSGLVSAVQNFIAVLLRSVLSRCSEQINCAVQNRVVVLLRLV